METVAFITVVLDVTCAIDGPVSCTVHAASMVVQAGLFVVVQGSRQTFFKPLIYIYIYIYIYTHTHTHTPKCV